MREEKSKGQGQRLKMSIREKVKKKTRVKERSELSRQMDKQTDSCRQPKETELSER